MKELVSVIVPVYNVYPYLDRCIGSLIKQTYKNIEILLINDGSTDYSLQKCIEWRKKDSRIVVIDKKNEKLGPTRNYGINIARGEYITSVDSDDWVHEKYVENLLKNALQYDADVVVCNVQQFFEADNRFASFSWPKGFQIIETDSQKRQYMKQNPLTAFFAKMYRKTFFSQFNIYQPSTFAQDLAILVQVIACANRIVTIPDYLYYYRKDRKDSITNTNDKGDDYIFVFEKSVQDMKRLGLFNRYQDEQLSVLVMHATALLNRCKNTNRRQELWSKYTRLYDDNFPGWKSKVAMKWAIYGSFNARWVAQYMSQSFLCAPTHYCFTSLISQFQGNIGITYELSHTNKIRENAVRKDIEGRLEEFCIEEEKGILIDFIDELEDILVTDRGEYITKSEAFNETCIKKLKIKKVIKYDSQEYMSLWEKSCIQFIDFLKNISPRVPVYLLKMRFATGYGVMSNEFSFGERADIELQNAIIKKMEIFFCKNYGEAIYIQGREDLYFSQVDNLYGCKRSYLNWYLYEDIGKKILEICK